jgi:SHS2 domain-containing protein
MAPPPFEVLRHTADLRLKVSGRTSEELFRNALKGMASLMKADAKAHETARHFSVSATDQTALLIDFLNEALYLANVNKEVYTDVAFQSFSDVHCEGELIGTAVEEFDEDIKAATYHEAEIVRRQDGYWEVTIVFDV